MVWVYFTFLAAFMQAWRNAFQSRLSKDVKVMGVTLARFLWAGPMVMLYLAALYLWQPLDLPDITVTFLFYAVGAALMQILATALMVQLFKLNNYAIGAGLAKSEAVVAAVFGVVFFGTQLSITGWIGVLLGGLAIFYMSKVKGLNGASFKTLFIGLSCGSAFALTSLWVRQASQMLSLPFLHRAAWVLLIVIGVQTLLLLVYLGLKDKATLRAVWQRPRLTLLTSGSSCLGSIGWFTAMSLQAVPYVKTLGQIEVFFTLAIGSLWLKQQTQIKDVVGLGLIAVAAVMVVWG